MHEGWSGDGRRMGGGEREKLWLVCKIIKNFSLKNEGSKKIDLDFKFSQFIVKEENSSLIYSMKGKSRIQLPQKKMC